MKNKRAIILCAGEAQRFGGEVKQLLPLYGNQTILGRIIDQLIKREFTKSEIFIVLAPHSDEIWHYVRDKYAHQTMCAVSKMNFGNTHTALMTKDLWCDQNLILLGDVIYSHDTMDKIVSCDEEIMFFGDLWETYAVEFTNHEIAEQAFTRGMQHEKRKLRHAYRGFIGKDLDREEKIHLLKNELYFQYIDCWITRDCDNQGEYTNILNELIYNGVLEKDK